MTSLYIQAEGSATAWQVWPVSDALPAGAVREAASYLFELRNCTEALVADLLIDDVPIEALRSREPTTSKWRWNPGFQAGSVEVTLRTPSLGTRRFEITTDPDLRKLTRENFDVMVREVLEDTFALFSLSAFRKGIARQSGNKPPPLARLEFLRSRGEKIIEAVEAIARSPRHFLSGQDVTVPLHRAIRATGPEIIKSFRSGVIRTETVRPTRLPAMLGGRLPERVTLRRCWQSVDIPEHRQIKACLKSWAIWLASVADVLTKISKSKDTEIVTTSATWAVRARRIARQFNHLASSGFMAEVSEGPAFLQMSSLFRNDPVYQRFYRLWQDMNLGLAAIFGDFLQMPLARTYELYELWCFLRLLRASAEEYGHVGMNLTNLFITDAVDGVTIAADAVKVSVGSGKVLCFQRQYEEYWVEPSGEGSFSRKMVPDVVFADTNPDGTSHYLIVLDAKYRIDDGLNDALNSIHTYRDALVRDAGNGAVEGVVSAAYLLTPHNPQKDWNDEPEFEKTSMPSRLFHPKYRGKFRFGAVTLKPGMKPDQLRDCLRNIVADATA